MKLNFDGSTNGLPGDARLGGLLRNNRGDVILSFLGHARFGSIKMAEMEALLMLWEACRADFRCIMVEGDSLCSIRWAFGGCSAPWYLADVVDKVKDLSKDIEISCSR